MRVTGVRRLETFHVKTAVVDQGTAVPNRRCKLCKCKSKQSEMVMIRRARLQILKRWYPNDVKSISDYVHKTCLASLGLHPFPDEDIPLTHVIATKITARIATIAASIPEERAPRVLTQKICKQLNNEYRIPTEDGQRLLRWNVSRWVILNLATGRGGVSASEDAAKDTEVPVTDLVVHEMFAGAVEFQAAPSMEMDDYVNMPAETLRVLKDVFEARAREAESKAKEAEAKAQHPDAFIAEARAEEARAKAKNPDVFLAEARVREIEAQNEQLRLKQQAFLEQPPAKRTKGVTTMRLTDAASRRLGDRYSISHEVLDELQRNHPDATLLEVFQTVNNWFVARTTKTACHRLDVRTKMFEGVPVVYGWLRGGPARRQPFKGTRYADQLLQHVRQSMWPEEVSTSGITDEAMSSSTEAQRRLPKAFNPQPVPGVTKEQQETDIRCLCRYAGVEYDAWPARPTTDVPPHLPKWSRFEESTRRRVKDMVDALGWTDPVECGYYMLVVFARNLPGWRFNSSEKGYKRDAGLLFRRALLATRGLTPDHHLMKQIRSTHHITPLL